MSDEPEVIEEDAEDEDAPAVLVQANEVAAIIPELDGKGGTQYRLGEDVYDTPEEAQEAFNAAVQGQPGMPETPEPEQQPEE